MRVSLSLRIWWIASENRPYANIVYRLNRPTALGVKEMSTTPFLSQGAFDMRMDIYKETAFKDYMDNDAIRFIKEERDLIIKEFIVIGDVPRLYF